MRSERRFPLLYRVKKGFTFRSMVLFLSEAKLKSECVVMKKFVSCAYNMDTGCVELRYADGGMYSIDCTAVENEVARNM